MLSHLNINQKYLYSLEKREGGNSCFILPLLLRNVIKFSFLIAVSLLHTLCLKNDERSTVKCQFHQNCENISMRNKIMKVAGSHDYYQRHIGFTEHLIRPLFFWLTLTSVTYYIITSSHHGQTWTYDWSHSTDSDNQPLISHSIALLHLDKVKLVSFASQSAQKNNHSMANAAIFLSKFIFYVKL